MPDHTAQELRGAALEHTGKLLAMMSRLKSRPLHPEEQEILDSAKQLRRLAAGPTREERLMVEWLESRESRERKFGIVTFAGDAQAAVYYGCTVEHLNHARLLKAAQGKEETDGK